MLESGYLVISSQLVPATLHYWILPENPHFIYRVAIADIWCYVKLDYPVWADHPSHIEDKTTVFLLVLGHSRDDRGMVAPKGERILQCPVLRKASCPEDAYERISFMRVTSLSVANGSLNPSQTRELVKNDTPDDFGPGWDNRRDDIGPGWESRRAKFHERLATMLMRAKRTTVKII